MKLADFAGCWRIARQIEDRRAARSGTLQGSATFQPDAQGLIYAEQGTLHFPGQPALSARQSYLWRATGAGIAVFFADGRRFHDISLTGATHSTRHLCPPDTYDVTYDFSGWPDWSSVWTVTGPRKDYRMQTQFTPA